MIVLVDAAILLKAFVREPGQDQAKALLTAGHDLVVPDVAFSELAALVAKKVDGGELTEEHGLYVLDSAPTFVRAVGLSGPLVRRAWEIGRLTGTSTTDGIYLAVADSLDIQLVTSDRVLAQKTQGTEWERRVVKLGAPLPN